MDNKLNQNNTKDNTYKKFTRKIVAIKPTMLSKVKGRQELRDSYLRRKKVVVEKLIDVLVTNMITELTKEIENV